MAMGLGSLGRGKKWRTIYLGVLHIIGAALGGAAVGGLLGWFGSFLKLSTGRWRTAVIAAIVLFALWQSLSRHPVTLGLHRQVPRKWARIMPPEPRYFLWGVQLGCGIATTIPYSAFLIVLATQLTSGVVLGCVSGILFGGTRGIMTLYPLLKEQNREYPSKLARLLPKLTRKAQRNNTLWVLVGGLALIIASWL